MEAELENCESTSVVTQLWLDGLIDSPNREYFLDLCEIEGLLEWEIYYHFDPASYQDWYGFERDSYCDDDDSREPAPLKPRAERRRDNAHIVRTRGALFHRFTPDKRPRPAGQYRKYNGGPDYMPRCYRYNRYQAMRRNEFEISLGFEDIAVAAEELRLDAEEREAMEKPLLDAYEAGLCDSLDGGLDDGLHLAHDDPDHDETDGSMDDSDAEEEARDIHSKDLLESIQRDEDQLSAEFERDLVSNVGDCSDLEDLDSADSSTGKIDSEEDAAEFESWMRSARRTGTYATVASQSKCPDATVRRIEENLRQADELDAVGREHDRIFGIRSSEKDRFEN